MSATTRKAKMADLIYENRRLDLLTSDQGIHINTLARERDELCAENDRLREYNERMTREWWKYSTFQPNSDLGVDIGAVLVEHEQEVTRLTAEREVAIRNAEDKDAIIAEQKRELDEANRKVNFAMTKWAEARRELSATKDRVSYTVSLPVPVVGKAPIETRCARCGQNIIYGGIHYCEVKTA